MRLFEAFFGKRRRGGRREARLECFLCFLIFAFVLDEEWKTHCNFVHLLLMVNNITSLLSDLDNLFIIHRSELSKHLNNFTTSSIQSTPTSASLASPTTLHHPTNPTPLAHTTIYLLLTTLFFTIPILPFFGFSGPCSCTSGSPPQSSQSSGSRIDCQTCLFLHGVWINAADGQNRPRADEVCVQPWIWR